MNMGAVIAANVRAAMQAAHVSQSDLARELDVPRQTISRIVLGKRNINAVELKQIADICGTSVADLVKMPRNAQHIEKSAMWFMGGAESEAARDAISKAERLMQIYEFELQGNRRAKSHRTRWSEK